MLWTPNSFVAHLQILGSFLVYYKLEKEGRWEQAGMLGYRCKACPFWKEAAGKSAEKLAALEAQARAFATVQPLAVTFDYNHILNYSSIV